MSSKQPVYFKDPDKLVDFIVDKVGKELVLGLQLGLGKPNNITNAIYRRAVKDSSIKLKIITALSLEPPPIKSDLERRMLEPMYDRIWKGYLPLEYATAMREETLPPNVEISEVFFKAGAFMNNDHMQQNYNSVNYTHITRTVTNNGLNVGGSLISARPGENGRIFSVGCNADTTMDAAAQMKVQSDRTGKPSCLVGEINHNLPFMYGDGIIDPSLFDAILENPEIDTALFCIPKEAVSTTDYMIGFNTSTIVKDDGTLQIGVGALGDAVGYGLDLRHNNNEEYRALAAKSGISENSKSLIESYGGLSPFDKGLYGATEMFQDAFLQLYKRDVMRRRCYDNEAIQKVVSAGVGDNGKVTKGFLSRLFENKDICSPLTETQFDMLVEYGIFKEGLTFKGGTISHGETSCPATLDDPSSFDTLCNLCLGETLKNGYWIHAGFYMGNADFYDTLWKMNEEERSEINLTSILNVNQLHGNNPYSSESLKVLQRKNARYVNTGLMATLSGAIVSDGLENGKVISGVGGQYNFVAMAHALSDARSIIMIRSTRHASTGSVSNIVFKYGHTTIPRHLRDLVVTEYGIADLRDRSDKEIIMALLNVADSRFQKTLLAQAKKARKIPQDYQIPKRYRNNTPEHLEALLHGFKAREFFPQFPYGNDFTKEEVEIGAALTQLKKGMERSKLKTIGRIAKRFLSTIPDTADPYLKRLDLHNPQSLKERFLQKTVIEALDMGNLLT